MKEQRDYPKNIFGIWGSLSTEIRSNTGLSHSNEVRERLKMRLDPRKKYSTDTKSFWKAENFRLTIMKAKPCSSSMATPEAAAASLGPRYAPDDPTLPQPWKGLIDGSTGLLYYWNPETNVTQYEKPSALPPPLPSGPPPEASAPKLAPIPGASTVQQNDGQGQQSHQAFTQQGQQMTQCHNIHKQPTGAAWITRYFNRAATRITSRSCHATGVLYAAASGQQILQQQNQHVPQNQQFSHQQEHKVGYQQREDVDFPQGKQVGFSPQQVHLTGASSAQNLPVGTGSAIRPQMSAQPAQALQFDGSSVNVQQPSSLGQWQQNANDSGHKLPAPRFPGQMGSSMAHSHELDMTPVGSKGYEENSLGRGGNDYYYNSNMDGRIRPPPQQPKLAAIPVARNQHEMRMGDPPLQNSVPARPSGFNSMGGPSMQNIYGQAADGPPFPNPNLTRPPAALTGTPGAIHSSSVEVYLQKHEVTATGGDVPAPFMTFEDTGFPPEILREIHMAGFTSPTPIQAQTWPIALQNRDIVAIAKTGSGKTLGYLIPAFVHLKRRRNNPQNGPTVVVLSPTRELATQIQDEALKFGRSARVSCTCLYGGAPKVHQLKELERGTDIVVATPGRLNDILEMKRIDFRQVSLLVLDEADRMLDMGFEPQIRKIVNEIPPQRQTLMYTATWPKEVRKIAGDLLQNPVQVNIGNVDQLAANKSITQYIEVVPQMEKQRRLEQILRSQERGSKAIIFCSTKKLCDQLARSIGRSFGAAAIHGDKSQGERDWVLNQFRSGKTPILVATDVAARGLDIPDIRVVINYDFPTGIEDYVHRIGRTGRAGATGVAYTFLSDQDWKCVPDLVKVMEGANQQVPPDVREMALRAGGRDRGGMNRFDLVEGMVAAHVGILVDVVG
ncbi:hypothetical protein RND71_002020 [Anisodus tanguticus]|uniref:RNA helicase n=1 Tax=Anisodus tanguticus TaxID=243964 RepID=A0AAE1SZ23_9SOLA|nr:hypothetical protein RND71_002020 [Anisodus tanguticus]